MKNKESHFPSKIPTTISKHWEERKKKAEQHQKEEKGGYFIGGRRSEGAGDGLGGNIADAPQDAGADHLRLHRVQGQAPLVPPPRPHQHPNSPPQVIR